MLGFRVLGFRVLGFNVQGFRDFRAQGLGAVRSVFGNSPYNIPRNGAWIP